MSARAQALEAALRELTAMVRGECPSLLNEDSGGCARLSIEIDALLAAPPVGVSPQPEGTWPADYIGRSFVDGASWWQFHHNGSTMFVSEREEAEAEAERRYGPPLSPVEPTPEPPQGVNRQWLSRIAARLAAHDRGDRSPSDDLFAWESLAYLLKYLSVEPTPDAQVCVWREIETAPKDGTEVLLLGPDGSIDFGRWRADRKYAAGGVWRMRQWLYVFPDAVAWSPIPPRWAPVPQGGEQ